MSQNQELPPEISSQETYAAPPPEAVGRLARSGAKWSVSLLAVRQMIGLGGTAIVCRLVLPDDVGLVAMVLPLTAFLSLVSDMGMTWANVQTRDIHWNQVNALFWLGAITGAAAWGICALAAPGVARYYGRIELVPICMVLGASLLLSGLAVQPRALLRRQMRQKEFSLVETISTAAAAVVAIAMAVAGMGYWALVAQTLALALVILILSLHQSGYRPGIPKLSGGMSSLLRFGGYVAAGNIVTFFQLYLDRVFVGRYCGAEELGFYSRATYLKTLPTMYAAIAVTDLMVPALVALRGDRERLGAAYRKALRAIAFVGCPMGVFLGVTSTETVRIIYGPNWNPVGPLLVWLSLPAIVLPLYTTMTWLFLAAGKARQLFLQALVITPVVCCAFYAGVQWGGTAAVAAVGAALFTVPVPLITLYCGHRAAGIRFAQTLKAVGPILAGSLLSALGGLGAGEVATWAGAPWLAVFAAKTLAMAMAYCLFAVLFIRPLPIGQLERIISGRLAIRR